MFGKTNIDNSGEKIRLEIQVPNNTIVTITNLQNGQSKTKNSGNNNMVIFRGLESGTWEEKITKGSNSYSKNIELRNGYKEKLDFYRVFGIKRPINAASPEWVRTDDAVGMTAVATNGEAIGFSDFDNFLPWSGMVKETLPTGDVMVKIPAFYYRRYRQNENGAVIEHIEICEEQKPGFELHPAFRHNNKTQRYIYVAAYQDYKADSKSYKSLPNQPVTNAHYHATHRLNQTNKGVGWGMIDLATWSAIQLLYLVEFASNNSQLVIGQGVVSGAAQKTGTSQDIKTGSSSMTAYKSITYRYIENLWGNYETLIDGYFLEGNTGEQYFCLNQNDYNSSSTGPDINTYTKINFLYALNNVANFYTQMGYDEQNPWILLPIDDVSSGSNITYFCDARDSSNPMNAKKYLTVGGSSKSNDLAGIFYCCTSVSHNSSEATRTSRGIYVPETF